MLGFVRHGRIHRLGARRRRTGDQSPHEGLAQALPRAAAPHARAAPRRHPTDGRVRREARDDVQRLPRGLVRRDARVSRLRDEPSPRARGAAGAALHDLRHARHTQPHAGPAVRQRAGGRVSRPPVRLSRPQRLRPRDREHARGRDGRRARRARDGQRHGRARRQRRARRGHRRASRSRRPRHAGQRACARRHQQPGGRVLRPPHCGEQADRRRERLHAGGRHPRRRRPQGPTLREPPRSGALRPPSYVRDGQAHGQGEPRVQPRTAEHHPDRRAEAGAAAQDRRTSAIRRSTSRRPTCRS